MLTNVENRLDRETPRSEDHPLRILIATEHVYLPQMFGGLQTSTDDLARSFNDRGHTVAVFSSLSKVGKIGLAGRVLLRLRRPFARDKTLGYDCFRTWRPASKVAAIVRRFKPDCVIVQSPGSVPLATEFTRLKVPVVFYFHNVEHQFLKGDPSQLDAVFVANSKFTAENVKTTYGLAATVVPPFVKTPPRMPEHVEKSYVLFVNPIKEKGLDVAVQIAAACPSIPFVFVKAWIFDAEKMDDLDRALSGLANVTVLSSQADTSTLYAGARIVLVPSVWAEAWGRVASEAQIYGVPVLATRIGGLPEAVGDGGILIDPHAPISQWSEALTRMWSDRPYYDALVDRARKFARRADMNPDVQLERLLSEVDSSILRHATP